MYTISEFEIDSIHLNQVRRINCCIPVDDRNQPLPVVMLLDGGKSEQLHFVVDLISELLSTHQIEPFILIGIENVDRNFDFTTPTQELSDLKWVSNTGNATQFKGFIVDELIPFVQDQYMVEHDFGIIGESLGGLLVINLLLEHHTILKRYISIDPSLWWNKNEYYKAFVEVVKSNKLNYSQLWFSSSKTKTIKNLIQKIEIEVEQEEIDTSRIHFHYDLQATHFSVFKRTLKQAIIWMYPKK